MVEQWWFSHRSRWCSSQRNRNVCPNCRHARHPSHLSYRS
nr:MAG TPA: acetyl-coA carboxylase zinc finger domain protein [Caudoviricetes sp.]